MEEVGGNYDGAFNFRLAPLPWQQTRRRHPRRKASILVIRSARRRPHAYICAPRFPARAIGRREGAIFASPAFQHAFSTAARTHTSAAPAVIRLRLFTAAVREDHRTCCCFESFKPPNFTILKCAVHL